MDRNRPRFANRNKSNSVLRKAVCTVLEPLEERKLLAATPIITEFVARIPTDWLTISTELPDWLEIYNPNTTSIDLGGYFLTDDPNNLNLWQIPAGQTLRRQWISDRLCHRRRHRRG